MPLTYHSLHSNKMHMWDPYNNILFPFLILSVALINFTYTYFITPWWIINVTVSNNLWNKILKLEKLNFIFTQTFLISIFVYTQISIWYNFLLPKEFSLTFTVVKIWKWLFSDSVCFKSPYFDLIFEKNIFTCMEV